MSKESTSVPKFVQASYLGEGRVRVTKLPDEGVEIDAYKISAEPMVYGHQRGPVRLSPEQRDDLIRALGGATKKDQIWPLPPSGYLKVETSKAGVVIDKNSALYGRILQVTGSAIAYGLYDQAVNRGLGKLLSEEGDRLMKESIEREGRRGGY